MSIETLKNMKNQILSCIQTQMSNLKEADTQELGQAIDMVKDLSEAIYYCTITEAMEKSDEQEKGVNNINYYTMPKNYYYTPDYTQDYLLTTRDKERKYGQMYYPDTMMDERMYYPGGQGSSSSGGGQGSFSSGRGNNSSSGNRGGTSYYTEYDDTGYMKNMPRERDPREGGAAIRRRMYMEGKENHNDPKSQLKELEAYLQELSSDITEMIKGASPEEKATLHQKMTMLANKMA